MSDTFDLSIGGMTCASCVARVERALRKVSGVQEASINLATESARVVATADPQMMARLMRAVRDAGYEPRSQQQAQMAEQASAWADFGPVAVGMLLSAPLVAPMVSALWGSHRCSDPSFKGCFRPGERKAFTVRSPPLTQRSRA